VNAMPSEIIPQDKVLSVARIFDVPVAVATAHAQGAEDVLVYGPLRFGQMYRVTETIVSNDGDALTKGERAHFLGAVTQPDSSGVALYFDVAGQIRVLRFTPDAPQQPDARRYFRNIDATLRPVRFDFGKRGKQLIAARSVMLHLRQKEPRHGD